MGLLATSPRSSRRALMTDESYLLLERWRSGDQAAADELFARYVDRLLSVVRRRMSPALAQRVDAEDVMQSVYRTFFLHARDGRYVLERSGDLWKLLVTIALNKLNRQIEFHTAGKRNFRREQNVTLQHDQETFRFEELARDPTPAEAAAVTEQLERVLTGLDETQRRVFELRLNGSSVEEIARDIGRSERTVRRVIEKVRADLERELLGT